MKKPSLIIRNQRGFILPYTLFIITIVLFLLTIQVRTYQNDIQISHNHQEQLKIETLIQMGYEQVKQDIASEQDKSGSVTYKYPPGKVSIKYTRIDKSKYRLNWDVSSTDKTYRKQTIVKVD